MKSRYLNFKELTIQDRPAIRKITSTFAPYSDFDFTSLLCWNTEKPAQYCMLNGNLVIRLTDYMNGERVYSLLGINEIDKTLDELCGLTNSLKYVPEPTVKSIRNKAKYCVNSDRDEYDYVYDLEALSHLNGKKLKIKRNKRNHFMRNWGDQLELYKINFHHKDDRRAAKEVFIKWMDERNRSGLDVRNEFLAIAAALEYAPELNLIGHLVRIKNEFVGFSINEVLDENYAICHFQKSLIEYQHLDVFVSNLVSQELLHYGCRFVNWEQDLGIPGLREMKTSYGTHTFLKKFSIQIA